MITIYCLASEDIIWYVGQTKNIKRRKNQHRNKTSSGCGSDLIPDSVEWEMIILEEVNSELAYDTERFYYDWFQPPANKNVPRTTYGLSEIERKQYNSTSAMERAAKNVELRRAKYNKWYDNNKDKLNERRRNRYAKPIAKV